MPPTEQYRYTQEEFLAVEEAVQHQLQDQDYSNEHKDQEQTTKYPGSHQGDGSQTNHVANFAKALQGLEQDGHRNNWNDSAFNTFDNNHNLSLYDKEERLKFMTAYVQAFNSMEFQSKEERLEAATDIAKEIFQSVHQDTTYAEYEASLQLDSYLLSAVQSNDPKNDKGPVHDLNISWLIGLRLIEEREAEFAANLHNSDRLTTDVTHRLNTLLHDHRLPYGDRSPDEEHKTFKDFKEQNPEVRERLTEDMVSASFSEASTAAQNLDDNHNSDHIQRALASIQASYAVAFSNTFEQDNPDAFTLLNDHMTAYDKSLAKAIEEGAGFVNASGYNAPDLAQNFREPDQAQHYLQEVQKALESLQQIPGSIDHQVWAGLETLATTARVELDYINYLKENAALVQDEEKGRTCHRLHQIASSMNYLLQPKTGT